MRIPKPNATGRNAEGPTYARERSRKMRRANSTPDNEAWGWMPQSLLESAAWLVCPDPARRAVMLIWTEHLRHAGQKNGELPVTYRNFHAGGIRKDRISEALAQAQALGFARLISNGRRSHGRDPGASHLWALTWLPIIGETQATNGWKSFKTVEQAKAALEAVRASRAKPGATLPENIDSAPTIGGRETRDFRALGAR